jgi:hypothetical protein
MTGLSVSIIVQFRPYNGRSEAVVESEPVTDP